ncbi:MAG TPA: hypothetical protein VF121_04300 [Thermoanaerobaculia bacterium]|nr:hypothetical protein [Thermoanaerobaculia bacterium]
MAKTEVYSWRLSPRLKTELEEAARAERKSLAELLEQIAREWLERSHPGDESDEERTLRLRAAAMKFVGVLNGEVPGRAENVSREVRARLRRRYGR